MREWRDPGNDDPASERRAAAEFAILLALGLFVLMLVVWAALRHTA